MARIGRMALVRGSFFAGCPKLIKKILFKSKLASETRKSLGFYHIFPRSIFMVFQIMDNG